MSSAAGPPEVASAALVVDLGTTALKVGLVTLDGRVRWQETHLLETTLLPGGGAVQDAASWWDLLVAAAARAVRAAATSGSPGSSSPIRAVAVTGQWSSTVPVGSTGVPVGPCIMWIDSRGGPQARARIGGPVAGYAPHHLAAWVRRTGGAPALDGADALGARWFLAARQPRVHAAARWLLEPVDYLTMRLTGRATASQASMVGVWLTDNRRLNPGVYDPDLVRRSGIDAAKLPPLVPSGSLVGPVRDDVARELGLPPGVPVVAGTGDAHTTALGSGAVGLHEAHLSLGTTSWVSCHVAAKKTDVRRQVASVPSTLPGRYLVVNNHETSGRALQWLRDVVSPAGHPVAFDELDVLAAQASPGSGGVLFTPWLAGERTPVADRLARAGWHNLSLATTRADLVRSVLEGVAFNDRWTLDVVERFVGRRLDDLRMVGGGARSDLWCQIHADVLDRRIEQVEDAASTGLRGAAFGAGIALGLLREEDLRTLVTVRRTYLPDPVRVAAYARLYAEFPRLYRRQKGMFARLNRTRP